MRRYHLNGVGIDALHLSNEPPPEPGQGQVLVRVRANSLNARDMMVIGGLLPKKDAVVPLSDGAGEVIAVGPGVRRVKVGDRVMGAFRQGWIGGRLDPALRGAADLGGALDGMLGEWALLTDEGVVKIPDAMSFEAAACLPCAGVTAWSALMTERTVRPGETVLVQGTGGVSLFSLQIARAAGGRVIAITSSAEKAERLRELGAEAVVNYRETPDWEKAVLDLTNGRGVDHVVEVGGAGTLARSMACTRLQGRISLVGLLDAASSAINPMGFVSRVLTLQGVSVGSRTDLEDLVVALVENGLSPVIGDRFAFEDAKSALRKIEAKQHFGKIVIHH